MFHLFGRYAYPHFQVKTQKHTENFNGCVRRRERHSKQQSTYLTRILFLHILYITRQTCKHSVAELACCAANAIAPPNKTSLLDSNLSEYKSISSVRNGFADIRNPAYGSAPKSATRPFQTSLNDGSICWLLTIKLLPRSSGRAVYFTPPTSLK